MCNFFSLFSPRKCAEWLYERQKNPLSPVNFITHYTGDDDKHTFEMYFEAWQLSYLVANNSKNSVQLAIQAWS